MLRTLWQDETGVIISAELVFILTLLVIGLVVGLSELQHAIVTELNDTADAIGELNQSYSYTGFSKQKDEMGNNNTSAITYGSVFFDTEDECDDNQCEIACDAPVDEDPKD